MSFFRFIPALILSVLSLKAQEKFQYGKQSFMLYRMMENYHYQPFKLDDSSSTEIYKNFILALDPHSLYFIASDLEEFNSYRNNLDDEIKSSSAVFLDKVTRVYKKRLLKADSIVNRLMSTAFDYTRKDTVKLSHGKKDTLLFARNEQELVKRWYKWLKYKTMSSLFLAEDDLNKGNTEVLSHEPELRGKLKNSESRHIKRLLNHPSGFESLVASIYLNTIALRYDPHSAYFSGTEKENFEASLSAEAPSFGIKFGENKNNAIEISSLVPGGPAWKSNELHTGDILIKIKFSGKDELDITSLEAEELEAILAHNNSNNKMDLTVKKPSGGLVTVTLAKEKLRVEENVIKGYILKGEKRIGYIALPDFYTQYDKRMPLGCANDMAREILKLQKEQIEGLILDLRYNGGGSMKEAFDLAGIFISEGPLCISKEREGKPLVCKDMNRGTAYDGPLVILQNGMSASASELVAAVLQDYNRAVIVGSPSYGKATSQIILPLDTVFSYNNPKSKLGYTKITTGKFYRITGRSHQRKGVMPDVELPELFLGEYREASERYALDQDSIVKKTYYTPSPLLPLKELNEKSMIRMRTNKKFKIISSIRDSLKKEYYKEQVLVLDIETFRKSEKRSLRYEKYFDGLVQDSSSSYTVENNAYESEILKLDSDLRQINQKIVQNIREDIYIEESYHIISDLINKSK